jgi:hypothetical protein
LEGGPVNPNLPIAELRLEDVKKILPVEFIQQLDLVYICGNYGDAVVARDTLAVFEHLRSVHPGIRLELHTNGNGRGAHWWARLARTIDKCIFAIDGLADTNHVYRREASWETVMRSARSFIEAGGRAQWTFIPFEHNEAQIPDAKSLSERLGFAHFRVKHTARFSGEQRMPVRNPAGGIEYYLSAASISAVPATPSHGDSWRTCEIRCKAAEESMIYISAQGFVFPCCWLGLLYRRPGDLGGSQFELLLKQLPDGIDSIDAKSSPIREILQNELFQRLIPEAWAADKPSRLRTCARFCGVPGFGGPT